MNESALKSQMFYGKQLTAFIGVALLVVAAQTWLRARSPIANTDTPRILAQIALEKDHSLFPLNVGDPGMGNYIPPYRAILRWLTPDAFAWGGMLRLFPIALFLILLALRLIMLEFRLPLIAAILLVLCASVIRDSGGGDYWGMTFEAEPLARYLFLALALLVFLPVLRKWPELPAGGIIFCLGAVGLLANLHPPSAIGWLCALSLVLLFERRDLRPKLTAIAGGMLLAGALALPAAYYAMKHAGATENLLVASMPFKEMAAHIVKTQTEVFPWKMNPLVAGRFLPQGNVLWLMLIVYLGALVAWGIWQYRNKANRADRRAWATLLLIHLPFVFALTRYQAIDLCAVMLFYAFCMRRERNVSRLEWLALTLLFCVTFVCWAGSAALRLIWQYGEIPRITFLTVNFSRMSRFIYLPMWMLAALWVKPHLKRSTWLPMLALAAAALIPLDWRRQPAFFLLLGTGLAGVELNYHLSHRSARRFIAQAAAFAALVFAIVTTGPRFHLDEREQAFYELCDWCRKNTPKEALFLATDEAHFAEHFAVIAQRTVVWHGYLGRYTSNIPEARLLMDLRREGNLGEMAEVARAAGVDYMIFPSSYEGDAVYKNLAGSIAPVERPNGP